MTIAVGFAHRHGVLLGADTELTAGDRKMHGSKIHQFKTAVGQFVFVFAGHVHNATSMLQKVEKKLKAMRRGDPIAVVERELDREYRRTVLTFPREDRPELDFWLVFAFRPPHGGAQLYASEGVLIRQEKDYAPVGIGEHYARQIIDAAISAGHIDRGDWLVLATYVLGLVKKQITHCGGTSLFIDVGNDGVITAFYGDGFLQSLEDWFGVFNMITWNLALHMANVSMSDHDFDLNLGNFLQKLRYQREQWRGLKARHAQITEAYRTAHRARAKPVPQSSKRGRKVRPPSRA